MLMRRTPRWVRMPTLLVLALAIPPSARASAVQVISPPFACGSGTHGVSAQVDLTALKRSATYHAPHGANPRVTVSLAGPVRFRLDFDFSGKTSCAASKQVSVRLGHTGLTLLLGPSFTLVSGGAIAADFTWTPTLELAFTLDSHGFIGVKRKFASGGSVTLTGASEVSLGLSLKTEIRLGHRTAIEGGFGPTIVGRVSHPTATSTCLPLSASGGAELSAPARGFPWLRTGKYLPLSAFGTTTLSDRCTTIGPPTGSTAKVVGVSVGDVNEACAVLSTGAADCWGENDSGALGDGTTTNSGVPVPVTGLNGATQIAAGSCARLSSGSLDCWGQNSEGSLGTGTTIGPQTCGPNSCSKTPVAVSAITTATEVAEGDATCALLADGSIDCWGANGDGEVGDGTTTDRSTPVQVGGIADATEVAAGADSCAVLASGQIECWGLNGGDLGNGTTTGPDTCTIGGFSASCSTAPVKVSSISNATEVAPDGSGACARLQNGQVDCWGSNEAGQLGNGTDNDSAAPVQVSGISDATEVATASNFACALLATGGVDCWGVASDLGDGSDMGPDSCHIGSCAMAPVAVLGITEATQIAAGADSACALLATGRVECWGSNVNGQLGDGSTTSSDVPVQVTGLPPTAAIDHSGRVEARRTHRPSGI